jgi:hypothetical protein
VTRPRILVVGEAPSRVFGVQPLHGDAGRRLARLAGLSHAALLDAVDAVNLLERVAGRVRSRVRLPAGGGARRGRRAHAVTRRPARRTARRARGAGVRR